MAAATLGDLGGEEARETLWELLRQPDIDTHSARMLVEALLKVAQPLDVEHLMQRYQALERGANCRGDLTSLASAIGAARLTDEIASQMDEGLAVGLEVATDWLGREPELAPEVVRTLLTARDRDALLVLETLRDEAARLMQSRGDDVDGWRAAWEDGQRVVGYRREAVVVRLFLNGLAAWPGFTAEARAAESAFALALVCRLSVDRDDEGRLAASDDPDATALEILAEEREEVLPGIVERVVDIGPAVVPQLEALIDPSRFTWGLLRILQVIRCLAYRHPGSCDGLVPAIIELMRDEMGDYVLEDAMYALQAIGAGAVPVLAEHLADEEEARPIYLTGALEEIPTEGAAQAILQHYSLDDMDEMQTGALAAIGSPSAIEPLSQIWEPGDRLVAENLFVLCELNGVERPELPEWRRLALAQEKRMAKMLATDVEPLLRAILGGGPEEITSSMESLAMPPPSPSTKRKSGPSKRERKRRKAQSRKNRRKR
ncbi:MAG: hypothetical protein FJZ90_20010 [Chloroflexi bacterium]|nr:hypothetical protein [Chloroflexota bacterium]